MQPGEIEAQFVDTFVIEAVRERVLHELRSHSKRQKFFARLSHRYDEVLDPKCMTALKSVAAKDQEAALAAALKGKTVEARCYFISADSATDQTFMSIADGIAHWSERTVATICVLQARLALFKGELSHGPPPAFLLHGMTN